jgi:hypothetical protein
LAADDETLLRCCGSLCAGFLGGGIMEDMAGVLTAQLLLLLVMLLTLWLGWSVSRLDGAWNDDISSCRIDRVNSNVNPSYQFKDSVFK